MQDSSQRCSDKRYKMVVFNILRLIIVDVCLTQLHEFAGHCHTVYSVSTVVKYTTAAICVLLSVLQILTQMSNVHHFKVVNYTNLIEQITDSNSQRPYLE